MFEEVALNRLDIATLKCPTHCSLPASIISVNDDDRTTTHRADSESRFRLLKILIAGRWAPLARVDGEGFELDLEILRGERRVNLEIDGEQHFGSTSQH